MTYPMFSPDGSGVLTMSASGHVLYTPIDRANPVDVSAAGPWVEPEDAPVNTESAVPVPPSVSRFQALAALMDAGLLADVDMALADAGPLAQLAWAEASEFRRRSPMILAMADGLGLTDDDVDALFRAAAQIEV